jgi:tetratricopeptide (TPR) repeat protein
MIAVRRLAAVGAFLGLAAAITSPRVWGEPKREQELKAYRSNSSTPPVPDRQFAEDLAVSRFAEQSFLAFDTTKGERYFALQLKPKLDPAPARPRDIAVLVDTSASKAQGPLEDEKRLVTALVDHLGPNDRMAIWTVSNDPKSLTANRFKTQRELAGALKSLDGEYPSGASNLRKGFSSAIAAMEANPSRQGVILFLGDGKSLADPVDADARAAIAEQMVKKEVACFTVPFGTRLEPLTLHGFPNATGGRCVRIPASRSNADFLKELDAALAVPVIYPYSCKFGAEATEVFPNHLPPIRSDIPTLVMGKLKEGTKTLAYRIEGSVAGKQTVVHEEPKVPAADTENYFLVGMVNQWRDQKDRPALMQADRALAFASERNQLARAELIAKAELALDQALYGPALKLYEQAGQLDPTSIEARNGVKVAGRMQELMERVVEEQGKLPADKRLHGDKLRLEVCKRYADELKFSRDSKDMVHVGRGIAVAQAPDAPPAANAQPAGQPQQPLAPAVAPDVLEEAKQRRRVVEEQQIRLAEEAVRAANRLVESDPNGARELLKRTIEGIRANPDVSDRVRASLGDRVERALSAVDRRGILVIRDQQEALKDAARVASRLNVRQLELNNEERIRERMRVIHDVIDKAREDEAYKQALALREDLVAQGRAVPVSVTAAYTEGLAGYHLREEQELRRIREEKFLATLLQVEKSHIPFPDEPPVEFPPAAVWLEMTNRRKVRYESTTLGAEVPKRTIELRELLTKTIKYEGLDDPKATLQDALDQLSAKYQIQFDINEKAFKYDAPDNPDLLKKEIASPAIPPMTASLGSVIRKILSRVPTTNSGATFIIRRDTIEITTGTFATAEKALRVYPAADLVLPIPQSVNVSAVNQAATLFGFAGAVGVQIGVQLGAANAFGIAGAQLGALGAVGAVGALGALGALGAVGIGGVQLGAVGALGAVGLQVGGLGAVGVGGVQLGAVGVGIAGAGIGGIGNQLGVANGGFNGQFQGAANLGVGGGAAGIGGGQLGQFGNLGGQFGLQGGDQSRILITLIRQVVGTPKDWLPAFDPITGKPLNSLEEGDTTLTGGENNQVAYFPPALALVVKGTSRIQTRIVGPLTISNPEGKLGNAGAPDRGDRIVRIAPDDAKERRRMNDPKGLRSPDQVVVAAKNAGPPPDPKKIWQDALARGVSDPGLIIAVADYLVVNRKFDHVAEFLKADLRQGIVVKPWVYQSLALALRESGGSAEEIERAETAALELEPRDARGYMAAARAMKQDKRYDRAVAFCRQASILEPNVSYPYAEALLYAELANDEKGMEWAAGNLVKQEWPQDNQRLHEQAHQVVESLIKKLNEQQKSDEARRLKESVQSQDRRDLTIKLNFQGDADLDLQVQEPTGSVCTCLNRQTVGGGVLVGDTLSDLNSETYTAATAFSGEYTVKVVRFRGRPLGDRAQLRIIQHQGTPDQTEKLVSVDLLSPSPIKVQLANGRRSEAAYVPPPVAQRPLEPADARKKGPDVLTQMRIATDLDTTPAERGMSGGVDSPGATRLPSRMTADRRTERAPEPSPNDRAFFQTKVDSLVKNSLDVTAQASVTSDRRFVRLSISALSTPGAAEARPVSLSDPVIPGGN